MTALTMTAQDKTTGASSLRAQRGSRGRMIGGVAALCLLLAGCTGNKDVILSGQRLDPRTGEPVGQVGLEAASAQENTTRKINMGKQVSRSAWTHVGAGPGHDAGHNAFTSGTPTLAWATPIGTGDNRKYRLSTTPVAANGLVVTLDAKATLTAVSASAGTPVWSVDLTPLGERAGDANGGTLAIDNGTVYATTGYGELVALDLTSGGVKWRQKIDAAGASGVTVFEGVVYVTGADGRAWAVETDDGRVRWQLSGTESVTSRIGAATPALTSKYAIFPFASGDLVAAFRKGGVRAWSASLAGSRKGVVYAETSDITADPVIKGDTFYVGNQAGRFGAFAVEGGARIWTASEGAYSPASVVGGSVFIVTDRNELVRLDASNGERIWGQQLPLYTTDKPRKRKGVYAHYGPIAAGGRLWVASSDGALRGFAPESGQLVTQIALPAPAASDPIVVGGVMYLLLATGELAALR
ncbi:PQQ-binding-like beta-propeller repeat protein [Celeribacter sp.]|uniref:PQQ-like beta-propeller repeat protein n=1 Tax=Celeribacter sp. TaxID=1890673 RepID=UPI003A95A2C1